MGKEILILGAGFGGLEAASILSEGLDSSHRITLIDKNDHFIIGFSKFAVRWMSWVSVDRARRIPAAFIR